MNLSKKITIVLISLVLLTTVFPNKSFAVGFFPLIFSGINGTFSFVNENIIGKIRSDYCTQYQRYITNGEWKDSEFRARLGKKICGETNSTSISNTGQSKEIVFNTPTGLVNFRPVGTKIDLTQIIYWTNIERAKVSGLSQLAENKTLDKIAEARIDDMFAKGYFEHTSPTGENASILANKVGYKYAVIGENIALGNFDGSKALVAAWMASEGHKANILRGSFTEIGVSAKEGIYNGQKVWMAAQIFGKPALSCKEPDDNVKDQIEKDTKNATNMRAQAMQMYAALNQDDIKNDEVLYAQKAQEYNMYAKVVNSFIDQLKKKSLEFDTVVETYNKCIKQ